MEQVSEHDGVCPACGQVRTTTFGLAKDWQGQIVRRVPISTTCPRGCTHSEIQAAEVPQ